MTGGFIVRPAVLVLLLLLPGPLIGQHWTEEEQSLIDAIEACWAQGATDPSMEEFLEACRPTDETLYWWAPETTPHAVASSWVREVRAVGTDVAVAQDLRPLRIRIDGDFGFIFLHGVRIWQAPDGAQRRESWRGYEVWRRDEGGWSFHSGMGAPDTPNPSN